MRNLKSAMTKKSDVLAISTSIQNPENYLSAKDPVLGDIIDILQKPAIQSTDDMFFDLVTCILEQQIHYRSKGTYTKKFMELIRHQETSPQLILTLDPHEFALKKISGLKFKALRSLAIYWQEHQLEDVDWDNLKDDEIKSILMPIRGIGAWTIDMILLFTLRRSDIFNPDDYHLKKIMSQVYQIPANPSLKSSMMDISNNWIPHRSLAVSYLLAWQKYLKTA